MKTRKLFEKMLVPFKVLTSFFIKLIRSNTGYSSKTFIMLWGVFMTSIWSFFLMYIIYLSVVHKHTVNWYGITAVIGSLATLAGVFIWGKVKGEQYEAYNLPAPKEGEDP